MKKAKLLLLILSLFCTPILAANSTHSTPASSHAATEGTSDSAITSNIKNKIAMDPSVSNLNISINTNKGVVKLSGATDTDNQAATLVQIAQATDGVSDVDTSDLKATESAQPFTDTVITAKVKGLFVAKRLFGKSDVPVMSINVETKDGVVYLTGTANDKIQASNAAKIAQSVKGVKRVVSHITVAS